MVDQLPALRGMAGPCFRPSARAASRNANMGLTWEMRSSDWMPPSKIPCE